MRMLHSKTEMDPLVNGINRITMPLYKFALRGIHFCFKKTSDGAPPSGPEMFLHDFANPLNALSLNLYALAEENQANRACEKYLSPALRSLERLKNITESARNELMEGRNQTFCLHKEIGNTLLLLRERAYKENVLLEYRGLQEIFIHGDPARFYQVLCNIISNSLDALRESDIKEKVIRITLTIIRGCAVICVTDNGPGIALDIQHKIFEPFFSTKAPCRGTGLGLYIAKSIIENKFGGSIEMESRPGMGTATKLLLPISKS